ncbi:MAG: hypothetical protein R3A45_08060 [Bdellovibrionota bacterium]
MKNIFLLLLVLTFTGVSVHAQEVKDRAAESEMGFGDLSGFGRQATRMQILNVTKCEYESEKIFELTGNIVMKLHSITLQIKDLQNLDSGIQEKILKVVPTQYLTLHDEKKLAQFEKEDSLGIEHESIDELIHALKSDENTIRKRNHQDYTQKYVKNTHQIYIVLLDNNTKQIQLTEESIVRFLAAHGIADTTTISIDCAD